MSVPPGNGLDVPNEMNRALVLQSVHQPPQWPLQEPRRATFAKSWIQLFAMNATRILLQRSEKGIPARHAMRRLGQDNSTPARRTKVPESVFIVFHNPVATHANRREK